MRRALSLALAAAAASCGCPKESATTTTPAPAPAGAKLGAPTETKVEPLQIKKEAKKQDQALILGTRNGAVTIPLAGRESAVEIGVMWVRPGRGNAPTTGGASPVRMVTRPTGDDKVRVGVYEQFAGGAGPQMRSAVWIAAFVAAGTLGKDLTDYLFAAESEGFVDGPSAGGLMTAAFLASLTGVAVDPEATMTGTVNPDGTIGPVGGIPHKFEGSIAKGKKKLGYPVGLRYQKDLNKGTDVDLHEVARAGGATAVEISDVYEAYELMTGQRLPEPEPLEEREMALPDETEKKLTEKVGEWRRLYARHARRVDELVRTGNLPERLERIVRWAKEESEEAEALVKQGLAAAAYYKILRAAVYAATATSVADILDEVGSGRMEAAVQRIYEEAAVQKETEAALETIGALAPGTMADHLMQMSAFGLAIQGFGYQQFGVQALRKAMAYVGEVADMPPADASSQEVRDELAAQLLVPVLMLTRGQAFARAAKEALEIEAETSLTYRCSLPNARRLAKSFGSAAAANLGYFESTIVKEYADAEGVAPADMQQRFYGFEPRYLVARWAFDLPRILPQHFQWGDDSLASVLATLSGAILSYDASSSLMAEYYSLGVRGQADGTETIVHEKAFMTMLASAERKSREWAHAAKLATGAVPLQARVAWQTARVLREGDVREKLKALELYWQASSYAQVAVMLARN